MLVCRLKLEELGRWGHVYNIPLLEDRIGLELFLLLTPLILSKVDAALQLPKRYFLWISVVAAKLRQVPCVPRGINRLRFVLCP